MEFRRTYEPKDVRSGDHSSVQEPDATNVHRRVFCAFTKKICAVVSVIFALLAGLVFGSVFGIAPLFQSSDAPRTDDTRVVNSTTEIVIENSTHAHAVFAVTSSAASIFRPSPTTEPNETNLTSTSDDNRTSSGNVNINETEEVRRRPPDAG